MSDRFMPKTTNGYDLMEASSALQKSIRRGDEETAMFFAVELWNSNFGEYLWKRLKIISSEDVGLAEPNISANIHALYEMYNEQVKKSDGKRNPERLFVVHAVMLLCRAEKSRLLDWTLITHWRTHEENLIEIPEYALDKHNIRGRQMGRGWKHFFEEGTKLENHAVLPGEEKMKKRAKKAIGESEDDEDAMQTPLF